MSEPSLALQGALVTVLKADAATNALVAGRIYDRVPNNAVFPYVRVGDDQVTPQHAECLYGSTEVFANCHVFSQAVGKVEAKKISGAIVTAINTKDLPLAPDYALVLVEHDLTLHLDEPDGLTSHSVVTFHALIDEA
jgi:hypothetical protein